MKRLLRRLSRVAAADACAAAAYQPLRPDAAAKASSAVSSPSSSFFGARRLGGGARVPEGHVPVCVGEEGGPVERFAVRAELLGQPAFKALLRRAAQEYGYGHPGALRIPCAVANFRRLLLGLSDPGCQTTDDADAALYYWPSPSPFHPPRSDAKEGVIGNLPPGKGKSVNQRSQLPAAVF